MDADHLLRMRYARSLDAQREAQRYETFRSLFIAGGPPSVIPVTQREPSYAQETRVPLNDMYADPRPNANYVDEAAAPSFGEDKENILGGERSQTVDLHSSKSPLTEPVAAQRPCAHVTRAMSATRKVTRAAQTSIHAAAVSSPLLSNGHVRARYKPLLSGQSIQRQAPSASLRQRTPEIEETDASNLCPASQSSWDLSKAMIPAFVLRPAAAAISSTRVTRDITSTILGGSAQANSPRPLYGEDQLYIDSLLSPHAPAGPGLPGLLFHLGEYNAESPVHVFVGTGSSSLHQYCGRYVLVDAGRRNGRMTLRDWHELSADVRKLWVHRLATFATLARMRLRARLGRRPTREEQYNELGDGAYRNASVLQSAFDKGEERLHVVGLRCVGYDMNLQTQLGQFMQLENGSRKRKRVDDNDDGEFVR
ncbi:hypothetical protein BV25DRAFT_1912785 [Artomyces pyxidatus]|uniref:Uncharacterized protein n=1 Tax=Artomyces pyxidatus TaxID=48021 RepID=A0ACB8TE90_9AGAM|nr:hypothetical protein BV25DRAFT_1912785 [Artomyces pyxidatus]